MGDYIKIEDAAMVFSIHSTYRYEDCMNDLIGSIADGAIELADVAPVVHARWVKIYDDTEPASKARQIAVSCSKCMGIPKDKLTESEYCPHCGAKMDGKGA